MKIKAFCLLLFIFWGTTKSIAQPVCTGKMLNAREGKIEPICYLRSPNPIGNITKYTIILSGVEIYEVQFEYDKEADSILIKFYDKQNTNVKKESVMLKPEDSHFLICDFKPNQKPITSGNTYRILFGIDQPDAQFVTLYQFQAIGGAQMQFQLQEVQEDVLAGHLEAVRDKEKIDNIRAMHAASISSLKRDMTACKDSIIAALLEREKQKSNAEATLIATRDLQASFTKKMDNLFINYFKNIHTYNPENFDVSFRFSCDAGGSIKVDAQKSINFINGQQRNWLRDSFLLRIKPKIEAGNYPALSDTLTNGGLKDNFISWFENRLSVYPNIGQADMDSFSTLQKQIVEELETYTTRSVNLPVIYTYSFKYKSSMLSPVWRYVKENNGGDKFIDKSESYNRVEITERLKEIFRAKYGTLQNGKYKLQVSTVEINNGETITQDINIVNKE